MAGDPNDPEQVNARQRQTATLNAPAHTTHGKDHHLSHDELLQRVAIDPHNMYAGVTGQQKNSYENVLKAKQEQRQRDAQLVNQAALQMAQLQAEIADIQRQRREIAEENARLAVEEQTKNHERDTLRMGMDYIDKEFDDLEAELKRIGNAITSEDEEIAKLELQAEDLKKRIAGENLITVQSEEYGADNRVKIVYKDKDGSYYTNIDGLKEKVTDPALLKQIEEKLAQGKQFAEEGLERELARVESEIVERKNKRNDLWDENNKFVDTKWDPLAKKWHEQKQAIEKIDHEIEEIKKLQISNEEKDRLLKQQEEQKKIQMAELEKTQQEINKIKEDVAALHGKAQIKLSEAEQKTIEMFGQQIPANTIAVAEKQTPENTNTRETGTSAAQQVDGKYRGDLSSRTSFNKASNNEVEDPALKYERERQREQERNNNMAVTRPSGPSAPSPSYNGGATA